MKSIKIDCRCRLNNQTLICMTHNSRTHSLCLLENILFFDIESPPVATVLGDCSRGYTFYYYYDTTTVRQLEGHAALWSVTFKLTQPRCKSASSYPAPVSESGNAWLKSLHPRNLRTVRKEAWGGRVPDATILILALKRSKRTSYLWPESFSKSWD